MENRTLLSICIPTYNRAEVLNACIKSIVTNKAFSDAIEIVISDNSSEDNTEEICMRYVDKFPTVKYYKNPENIGGDRNFLMALSKATGVFRKLLNDYSIFTETGLEVLLNAVRENLTRRPALLFDNGGQTPTSLPYNDFNKFCENIGWRLSWIGRFGYWQDDFDEIPDKEAKLQLQFIQSDLFLRSFLRKESCVIYHYRFTKRLPLHQKQGDYNFFKIHINNYLAIFEDYVEDGRLRVSSYSILCRKVLWQILPFFVELVVRKNKNFSYETEDAWRILKSKFSRYKWFYPILIVRIVTLPIRRIKLLAVSCFLKIQVIVKTNFHLF